MRVMAYHLLCTLYGTRVVLPLTCPDFSHNSVLTSRLHRNLIDIIFFFFLVSGGEGAWQSGLPFRLSSSRPGFESCCNHHQRTSAFPTIRGCTATILLQSTEPMPASLRPSPPRQGVSKKERKRERRRIKIDTPCL